MASRTCSTRCSCAASTTTRARPSSSSGRRRTSTPRSAAAAATTGSSRRSAGRRPGIGFGAGLERLLLAMEREGATAEAPRLDFFFAFEGRAPRTASSRRSRRARAGALGGHRLRGRSMKGQLTQAQRLGAGRPSSSRARRRRRCAAQARRTASYDEPRYVSSEPGATSCAASCARTTTAASVTVAGWADTRRDHGGLVFVDLRDHRGKVQLVDQPRALARRGRGAHESATSTSSRRPARSSARAPETVNPPSPTGQIEVQVDELGSSPARPRSRSSSTRRASKTLRLRHRWLDLRREKLQRNIRLRGKDGRRSAG